MALQLQPSQGLIPHISGSQSVLLRIPAASVGPVVKAAALQAGFRKMHLELSPHGTFAGSKSPDTHYLRTGDIQLLVNWAPLHSGGSVVEWAGYRRENALRNIVDQGSMSLFALHFEHCLARWRPGPEPPMENPLVPPGGRPPTQYRGQMYDYSPLATADQLAGLQRGVLPFGSWAFGWGDQAVYGPPLYMPYIGSDPGENLGVLLCAPSGSGKTHWLLQWAAAAARDGRSVFLVDVKGNMRPALEQALARLGVQANILHFTTAPHEPSDRINFLAGLHCNRIDATEALYQIAEALLPAESFKGDNPFIRDNTLRMAAGALKLLKLIEHFVPCLDPQGGHRETDLADLLDLIEDEEGLMSTIDGIRDLEAARGQAAGYSVRECVNELAIALGRVYPTEQKPFLGGQRPPDATYIQYMLPVINALQPFRASGAVGPRIRSFGVGRELRLDRFGATGQPPVIALLSFRESDSQLAKSALGMAVRRLQEVLHRRFNQPAQSLSKILLLLDETRRIAGFDPVEFVPMIREARAGYVLVYQSLGMIHENPDKITTVLSNLGTQMYLNGLRGADLKRFNEQLYQRRRDREMPTVSTTPEGRQNSAALTADTVPFLEENAALQLPGGRYPALVYIRDCAPPFLVDRVDRPGISQPARKGTMR